MLQGDLNDLQQLALVSLLQHEAEEKEEREWQQFRTQILVAGIRPENVADVLETLDGHKEEQDLGQPLWAEELTDEEMETYVPVSLSEADAAVDALRRFGVSHTDFPD